MKSWKTTVAGLLTAIGIGMQASDNAVFKTIGIIVAAAASLFFGVSAKDNNVTGGTKQQ